MVTQTEKHLHIFVDDETIKGLKVCDRCGLTMKTNETELMTSWVIVKNTISYCKVRGYERLVKSYLKNDKKIFIEAVNFIGKQKVLNAYKNWNETISKELLEVLK